MDFKEVTKQLRANLEGAIRRWDKAVSRAIPHRPSFPQSRRRNRGRWVSLKIGLVWYALYRGQCLSLSLSLSRSLSISASVSFARPSSPGLSWSLLVFIAFAFSIRSWMAHLSLTLNAPALLIRSLRRIQLFSYS